VGRMGSLNTPVNRHTSPHSKPWRIGPGEVDDELHSDDVDQCETGSEWCCPPL